MAGLRARAAMLGEKAAADARDRIAGAIAEGLPGVATAIEADRIVLTGRGLRARLLREPVLRWIGSLVR